mgnify:FL=1
MRGIASKLKKHFPTRLLKDQFLLESKFGRLSLDVLTNNSPEYHKRETAYEEQVKEKFD